MESRTLPPYTWDGEIYQKLANEPTRTVRGYIAQYAVLDETEQQYPIAFLEFVETGTHVAKDVEIAAPLKLNGHLFACDPPQGKSQFDS